MAHPSARNAARLGVLTALVLSSSLAPHATTPAAAQLLCEPGVFGEAASFEVRRAEDMRVTSMRLEFQCGDVLSDGTLIPTGYRVELEGECDGAPCDYPVVMARDTAREGQLEATFVRDGRDYTVRIRAGRRGRGATVSVISRPPGRGQQRDRAVYRMGEG